jgi:CheY-like chemotaxis protein
MKIFLSSTYEDLVEHRAKAAQAVERLGQEDIRMEVFGARPGEATDVCLDEINSSDAFVGIYAHRYGYIPVGSEKSITEQEFDFAKEKDKPIFCYFVDETHPWRPNFIESDPGKSKLNDFKQTISQSLVRDTFTTPDDLAYKVATSLGHFLITKKVKEELENVPGSEYVSSARGRNQVARRAARLETIIRGACILLVNDVPKQMQHVIAILRNLGIEVEIATSSDYALALLEKYKFDAVISDMRRGQVTDEGIRFLKRMRDDNLHCDIIFTVGQYQPEMGTPPYAFGITNRIDELLNLLFDILERTRG